MPYFLIIVRSAFERFCSLHTGSVSHWCEPTIGGLCFCLPGRGPVTSSRCGQGWKVEGYSCKLMSLYIQPSEWNLLEPSEPSSPSNPRLSTIPPHLAAFACVSGSKRLAVKYISVFLASPKGNVAGGERSQRLSCFKCSEKRDCSSPLRSQSNPKQEIKLCRQIKQSEMCTFFASNECCLIIILTL